MAAEKLIQNLQDLQEAARVASRDGLCRIRLASGEMLVLYAPRAAVPGERVYDVTDPEEQQVVLSCLEPGGQVYRGDEGRAELSRRLKARGTETPNGRR